MTPPPHLHELEAELMSELWTLGEGTSGQVRDSLNARSPRQRAYTTVLSVLTRLHDKGLLHRRRSGRADIYTPTLTEAEYRVRRAGVGAAFSACYDPPIREAQPNFIEFRHLAEVDGAKQRFAGQEFYGGGGVDKVRDARIGAVLVFDADA